MGFLNPIVGSGGALVRPAIKSPNYVAGVSGWIIRRDGTVEFADGTFRGTITAAELIGSVFGSSEDNPSIWINEDDENSCRVYDSDGNLLCEIGANAGSQASAVFYDRANPLALSIGEQIQWLHGSLLTQLGALYQKGTAILFNTILSGGIAWDTAHAAWVPLVPGTDNLDTWHFPTMGTGWATGPAAGGGSYPPLQWHADTEDGTKLFGCFHATSATPSGVMATGFPAVNMTKLGGVGVAGGAVKTTANPTTISCFVNGSGELRNSGLPTGIAVNDTFMINATIPRGNIA